MKNNARIHFRSVSFPIATTPEEYYDLSKQPTATSGDTSHGVEASVLLARISGSTASSKRNWQRDFGRIARWNLSGSCQGY